MRWPIIDGCCSESSRNWVISQRSDVQVNSISAMNSSTGKGHAGVDTVYSFLPLFKNGRLDERGDKLRQHSVTWGTDLNIISTVVRGSTSSFILRDHSDHSRSSSIINCVTFYIRWLLPQCTNEHKMSRSRLASQARAEVLGVSTRCRVYRALYIFDNSRVFSKRSINN